VKANVSVASTGQGRLADIQTALSSAAAAYFNGVTTGQPASYSGLLVALSLADPDIQTIQQLQIGLTGSSFLSQGVDLTWDPTSVPSVGCRFTLQSDSAWPAWSLS